MKRAPLLVAAMFLATFALAQAAAPVAPPLIPDLASLPGAFGPWVGREAPPLEPEVAEVLAADVYVHRFYRGPGPTIEMDVAYYGQPRVGSSMHSPLNCLPGTGWTMSEPRVRRVNSPAGTWDVREVVVSRGAQKWAMTYWFQSRDRVVANEFTARFQRLGDALRRRPADAALVRLMTPLQGDAAAEQTALTAFAAQLIPEIGTRLQGS